jgi:hypothetical protein
VTAASAPRHLSPRSLEASARRSVIPWSSDHLVGVMVVNGVGLILLIGGWWKASSISSAHSQLAWLNLSVLGLVLAGAANGLWLARVRRVVTLARSAALPFGPGQPFGPSVTAAQPALAGPKPGTAATNGHGTGDLVSGPGMSFYHRPSCLMVAGKEIQAAARSRHERAGRRPCEVCWP